MASLHATGLYTAKESSCAECDTICQTAKSKRVISTTDRHDGLWGLRIMRLPMTPYSGYWRTPDGHIPCLSSKYGNVFVHHITVGVVFDDEMARIVPVVENLRAVNVTSNAPHQFVPFLFEPLMSHELGIDIFDLERRMMYGGRVL